MTEPFIGSAAVAAGTLTAHALRTRHVAVHRDVYLPADAALTPVVRAKAAWLRSRGHGVLAGFSASAVHGSRWIDAARPATLIDSNRRRVSGLEVWAADVDADEIDVVDGMRVTSPVRTAVDLARRYPVGTAVAAIDALARATRISRDEIMAATLRPGRHGMKRARRAIGLVDPGAESPRETWLRLVIVRAGFPPPDSQLPIYNEYGVLIGVVDLAYPDLKLAIEYEGRHHRTRDVFDKDIRRIEEMIEQDWIVLRITAADTEATVVRRLLAAWSRRSSLA